VDDAGGVLFVSSDATATPGCAAFAVAPETSAAVPDLAAAVAPEVLADALAGAVCGAATPSSMAAKGLGVCGEDDAVPVCAACTVPLGAAGPRLSGFAAGVAGVSVCALAGLAASLAALSSGVVVGGGAVLAAAGAGGCGGASACAIALDHDAVSADLAVLAAGAVAWVTEVTGGNAITPSPLSR
jgi:hypothetical protein